MAKYLLSVHSVEGERADPVTAEEMQFMQRSARSMAQPAVTGRNRP